MLTFGSGVDDLGAAELKYAEGLLEQRDNRGMMRELEHCRHMRVIADSFRDEAGDAGLTRCSAELVRHGRIADECGDRWGRIHWRVQAIAHLGTLGTAGARAELEVGLQLAEGVFAGGTHRGAFLHYLALIDAMEGNWSTALPRLRLAWEQSAGRGRGRLYLGMRFERACLLLGAVARGIGDRETLLDRVERDLAVLAEPRTLLGEPVHYPTLAGMSDYLAGQLAAARGRADEARAHFERAVTVSAQGPIYVHYTATFRMRIGDLIGGPEGAAMRAQAEQELASKGLSAWSVLAARFEDEKEPRG